MFKQLIFRLYYVSKAPWSIKKTNLEKCLPLSPLSGGVACLADGSFGNGCGQSPIAGKLVLWAGLFFFDFYLMLPERAKAMKGILRVEIIWGSWVEQMQGTGQNESPRASGKLF
jgi:hypothetical protein